MEQMHGETNKIVFWLMEVSFQSLLIKGTVIHPDAQFYYVFEAYCLRFIELITECYFDPIMYSGKP